MHSGWVVERGGGGSGGWGGGLGVVRESEVRVEVVGERWGRERRVVSERWWHSECSTSMHSECSTSMHSECSTTMHSECILVYQYA
jgi:hypothetical protein